MLATAGIKPNEVSVIGIGSGAGAIAAVRSGQVDAFVGLDPVITTLEKDNLITIVADTRNVAESDKLFGGPMVAAASMRPRPSSGKIRSRSKSSSMRSSAPTAG